MNSRSLRASARRSTTWYGGTDEGRETALSKCWAEARLAGQKAYPTLSPEPMRKSEQRIDLGSRIIGEHRDRAARVAHRRGGVGRRGCCRASPAAVTGALTKHIAASLAGRSSRTVPWCRKRSDHPWYPCRYSRQTAAGVTFLEGVWPAALVCTKVREAINPPATSLTMNSEQRLLAWR